MGQARIKRWKQSLLFMQLVIMDKEKLIALIEDLYWEYDRMSSSGKETLDELSDLLDMKEAT